MGRDASSSHRQSQPYPPSCSPLSFPGSWPPSQCHGHPSCLEDPGTGSKVWGRELNQRSGPYKGQIWDPILLSPLCLGRGMFPCLHIQLLRVNTGWLIFTCPLWGWIPPGESQPLTPGALVWEGSGHLRCSVEIWDALCLLSGEGACSQWELLVPPSGAGVLLSGAGAPHHLLSHPNTASAPLSPPLSS